MRLFGKILREERRKEERRRGERGREKKRRRRRRRRRREREEGEYFILYFTFFWYPKRIQGKPPRAGSITALGPSLRTGQAQPKLIIRWFEAGSRERPWEGLEDPEILEQLGRVT